ncbi:MAG: hypothetical protein MHM6MM_003034 [Cercozoa sp. M6MM]
MQCFSLLGSLLCEGGSIGDDRSPIAETNVDVSKLLTLTLQNEGHVRVVAQSLVQVADQMCRLATFRWHGASPEPKFENGVAPPIASILRIWQRPAPRLYEQVEDLHDCLLQRRSKWRHLAKEMAHASDSMFRHVLRRSLELPSDQRDSLHNPLRLCFFYARDFGSLRPLEVLRAMLAHMPEWQGANLQQATRFAYYSLGVLTGHTLCTKVDEREWLHILSVLVGTLTSTVNQERSLQFLQFENVVVCTTMSLTILAEQCRFWHAPHSEDPIGQNDLSVRARVTCGAISDALRLLCCQRALSLPTIDRLVMLLLPIAVRLNDHRECGVAQLLASVVVALVRRADIDDTSTGYLVQSRDAFAEVRPETIDSCAVDVDALWECVPIDAEQAQVSMLSILVDGGARNIEARTKACFLSSALQSLCVSHRTLRARLLQRCLGAFNAGGMDDIRRAIFLLHHAVVSPQSMASARTRIMALMPTVFAQGPVWWCLLYTIVCAHLHAHALTDGVEVLHLVFERLGLRPFQFDPPAEEEKDELPFDFSEPKAPKTETTRYTLSDDTNVSSLWQVLATVPSLSPLLLRTIAPCIMASSNVSSSYDWFKYLTMQASGTLAVSLDDSGIGRDYLMENYEACCEGLFKLSVDTELFLLTKIATCNSFAEKETVKAILSEPYMLNRGSTRFMNLISMAPSNKLKRFALGRWCQFIDREPLVISSLDDGDSEVIRENATMLRLLEWTLSCSVDSVSLGASSDPALSRVIVQRSEDNLRIQKDLRMLKRTMRELFAYTSHATGVALKDTHDAFSGQHLFSLAPVAANAVVYGAEGDDDSYGSLRAAARVISYLLDTSTAPTLPCSRPTITISFDVALARSFKHRQQQFCETIRPTLRGIKGANDVAGVIFAFLQAPVRVREAPAPVDATF